MKIQDSAVHLSANHEASRSRHTESAATKGFRQVFDSLAATAPDVDGTARQRVQKLLQSLVEAILAALDGKKCGSDLAASGVLSADAKPAGRGYEMSGRRQFIETVSESEKTSVRGQGCVRTGDGRDIAFDFALDLSRNYNHSSMVDESGSMALRDPLVLSFSGKSCELNRQRIAFDLNADGVPEAIPGLGAGSGFLVFDRNGNGRADDGSELLGVASGNGFADLAGLDDNHNGWVDEGDAAFDQLAVWSGDGFASLKARGIGALYTAAVDAPFSLKTADNELLGQIRSAGLYLGEAGEVGYLQQVDLAVSGPVPEAPKPAAGGRSQAA